MNDGRGAAVQYVTESDIAARYGVSRRSVKRWRAMGMPCLPLPGLAVSRPRVRYDPTAVRAWLEGEAAKRGLAAPVGRN